MKLSTLIKQIPKNLIDIFLPAYCFNCKELLKDNRKIICSECFSCLPEVTRDQHKVFLERMPETHFDNLIILYEFSQLFRQIMYYYKYQGYIEIAEYFAQSSINKLELHYDLVSFVPLHPTKLRERGFNQSALIAEKLCKIRGLELHPDLIKRTRYTKSQTKLNRNKRRENVKNAFELTEDVNEKNILFIDDVITTGATVNECAGMFKKANAKRVDIIAMATPTDVLQSKLESNDSDLLILT
ncbi:MAG: ComF family protein [Calditrichae bacterium]|nr:ComF family protein [Calditrichota bacterium]MCB9059074.1 ComF family protein [Calditrichia bacterium]